MSRSVEQPVDVLIAGGGRAGLAVVETLVAEGFDGSVMIVGAEPGLPYERPQVSKGLLAGTVDAAACELAGADALVGSATTQVVSLTSRTVASLDPVTRVAQLDDGCAIAARHVVLATGTRPRMLPGLELGPSVHVLRTAADAERLRVAAHEAAPIIIVGAGFIGMEAASSLRSACGHIIVVDPAPRPMAAVLAPHLSDSLASRARRDGIELRLGVTIDSVERGGDGPLSSVLLSDGERVRAPEVLVAVGSIPSSPLGLHPDGIITDSHGRTQMASVSACGDLARWYWPDEALHARIEHWATATGQGRAVGAALLSGGAPRSVGYRAAPLFWSDQFGVRVQAIGHARGPGAWLPHDGAPEDAAAYVCADTGRVKAVATLDRPDLIAEWRRAQATRISNAA
jgi:NADPH-dependent 2,4-dienoyl-CoA reductase/sulfur reductase-like enzyme